MQAAKACHKRLATWRKQSASVVEAFYVGLTLGLRLTAVRTGGVVHVTTQVEPRSGFGLNELLGRTVRSRPTLPRETGYSQKNRNGSQR